MQKTSWNIPRDLLRSAYNVGSGSLAPLVLRVEARVLKARALPIERFQNVGPIERDGFRELRHCDRKANESLLLRLKFHVRYLGLFWQAE